MIKRIDNDIVCFNYSKELGIEDSNSYLLISKKVLIDTNTKLSIEYILKDIALFCDPDNIEAILLTHLHYDHIGCIPALKESDIYCSKKAIDDLRTYKNKLVHDNELCSYLMSSDLKPLKKVEYGLDVISTPGHTNGSVCFYDPIKKILFSGDTMFKSFMSRNDFVTSDKDDHIKSISKISKLDYKLLLPGHDY